MNLSLLATIPLGELAPKTSGYRFTNATSSLTQVISNLLGIITVIAGLAFIFYFMIGAINWITSGGDTNKAQAARLTLTNALIGLTLTVLAYPVIQLLSRLLGVPLAEPKQLINQLFR